MNQNDDDEKGLILDQSGKIQKPPRQRPISLNTAFDVRKELQRVYTDARRGDLPTQDAGRLANILNIIRQTIETSDLEARIEQLEASNNGNK